MTGSAKERRVRRETFGALLRRARHSRGWGLRNVAQRLSDTGPREVASWEAGEALPSMVVLYKLLNVLCISTDCFFEVVDRYQALQYAVFPFS